MNEVHLHNVMQDFSLRDAGKHTVAEVNIVQQSM